MSGNRRTGRASSRARASSWQAAPIPYRENAIDGLYAQYPGALVLVDRVRNIGSLALSRAKLAGMPRAYPPGLAPRNGQPGTSISSASASRQGSKRLKNLLVFSCSRLAQPQPMGRALRALPRQGHAARQGAESRGGEAAQGDLRDHEGQGSVRSLTAGGDRRPGRACVSIAKTPIERANPP